MSDKTANILKWIVTLCLPFMFAAMVTTLIIAPWLPRFEYEQRGNVPPDQYGWTTEERLELAVVATEFLSAQGNAESTIFMLEEQRLPDSDEPLYNQREIDHMIDVKVRTDLIRRGGIVLGVVVVAILTLFLYRNETEAIAYRALRNGGLMGIGILAVIGGFMLIAWETFFVQFHELLFPPGTWTFFNTDSLIRLFPWQLWFNVGTYIVGGTLLCVLLSLGIGQLLLNKTMETPVEVTSWKSSKRNKRHRHSA